MHQSIPLVVVGVLAAAPLLSFGQFAKPEDAVRYRQSVMNVMGNHFGRLAPVAKGEKPFDAAAVQADVAVIDALHKLPFDAFGPGTDVGQHKAKPEVWTDAAKFQDTAKKMQEQVGKLSVAAKSGDAAAFKAAFGEAGKSCKACHDDFRKK
jgi:cytochrome c556